MSTATASDFEVASARPLLMPLISAAGCVALADWLFYGWQPGISLALFLGVLGVVAIATNRRSTPRNIQIVMSAAFIAGLLALVEDISDLSGIVGTLATALFVIVITAGEIRCREIWRIYSVGNDGFLSGGDRCSSPVSDQHRINLSLDRDLRRTVSACAYPVAR
jgi:hypothetical protein